MRNRSGNSVLPLLTVAVLLLTLRSVLVAPDAHASGGNPTFQIAANAAFCVGPQGLASATAGALIELQPCNPDAADAQSVFWSWAGTSTSTAQLVWGANTAYCLDAGANVSNGTGPELQPCNPNAPGQQWANPGGNRWSVYTSFFLRASARVLGAPIWLWDSSGALETWSK